MTEKIKKTIEALKANNIGVFYAESKEEILGINGFGEIPLR